jgi:5-(carboxyamino)imidazole ribonucleotide synthase
MGSKINYAGLRLGIIGGGQLGKIMSQKAKKMGLHVTILDPTPNAPAAQVSDRQIVGGFYDCEKLTQLVKSCDVTTVELEHIDVDCLKKLSNEGHTIVPSPDVLMRIQDKYEQKKLLHERGIPVPAFKEVQTSEDLAFFGFPVIQKTKKGGYDGRGVLQLKSSADLQNAITAPSFLEEMVDIDKELAVMVARNHKGEVAIYPVVEMLFDERVNICDSVMAPARIDESLHVKAKELAVRSIEALDGEGLFGVEMFLTKKGELLINEIAPRPHNSGHYTVESCATSQFEQVVRAVVNLPLGSTKLLCPSVMVNLLGEEGFKGEPVVEGMEEALAIEGLSFYLYGKEKTAPFRKMGHITVLDENLEIALEKAMRAKEIIKIKGSEVL